jgi:hypothetical protein
MTMDERRTATGNKGFAKLGRSAKPEHSEFLCTLVLG